MNIPPLLHWAEQIPVAKDDKSSSHMIFTIEKDFAANMVFGVHQKT